MSADEGKTWSAPFVIDDEGLKPASGDLPDAAWVNERALEAAEWLAGEDLFLYLQYMDPHEPYRDHETGREWTYGEAQGRALAAASLLRDRAGIARGDRVALLHQGKVMAVDTITEPELGEGRFQRVATFLLRLADDQDARALGRSARARHVSARCVRGAGRKRGLGLF